eukprot:1221749-Pleurochrysis_carterae.AAC.1
MLSLFRICRMSCVHMRAVACKHHDKNVLVFRHRCIHFSSHLLDFHRVVFSRRVFADLFTRKGSRANASTRRQIPTFCTEANSPARRRARLGARVHSETHARSQSTSSAH